MQTRWLLLATLCASLAWSVQAQARSFRVNQVPNGNTNSCQTCHNGFGGPRNVFGQDIERTLQGNIFNAPARWAAVFDFDSDGDGFTNGEEMKDPFGAWVTGAADPGLNSNPANRAQIPTSQGQRPTAQNTTHTLNEDATYNGQIQATDADNNIVRYRVVEGPENGTVQITNAATGTYTYTPDTEYSGTDTFTFQVFDGTNLLGEVQNNAFVPQPGVITLNVTPINDPPVVETEGDQTGFEGQALTFVVDADDTEDGALEVAAEDLPRGATFDADTGIFAWTPDYDQAGTYALTFTATDEGGLSVSATVEIDVVNVTQPPTISQLNGTPTGDEGTAFAFSAVAVDPDDDPLTYTWDFGTGDTLTGPSVSYVWPRYGAFTVTLAVSDGFNRVTQTYNVTVNNLPPVANAGEDFTYNEGQTFQATGAYTDPGPGATFTYVWDFDNGATRTNRIESYAYGDDGTFNATFTVSDGQLSDEDTVVFTINNVAPTADAGNNRTTNEGQSYTFTGTYTDPGTLDTHTQTWDYGDGTSGGGTHTYPDQGTYTVTYTVADDDDGVGTDTVTMTVNNVAPSVRSQPPLIAALDQTYVYVIDAYDPGQDTISFTLLEGPTGMNVDTTGRVTYNPIPEHEALRFTVRIRLDDEDGGTYTHQYTLAVGIPDRDNDGADDDCEALHGLNPDDPTDGPLDYDGDGLTNAVECGVGKNPRVSNAPNAPSINEPFNNAVVNRLPPISLYVNNATDPDGDPVTYIFEIYGDEQLTVPLRVWRDTPQGNNRTGVQIDFTLLENARYWWRARAGDGAGYSPWTNVTTFVYSVINEAPPVPTLIEPTGEVGQSPTFVFQAVRDPEGDLVSYEIQVFAPNDTFHSGGFGILDLGNPRVMWQSPTPFVENTTYTWRARASNNQIVISPWSAPFTFTYNALNAPPSAPVILSPEDGVVIEQASALVFSAQGSTDEDNDPITYTFRIATDPGFSPESIVAEQSNLSIGPNNTITWDFGPNADALAEDATFWWDVRAKDPEAYSPAAAASFTVSLNDGLPGTPTLQSPANDESLRTPTPTYTWINTSDPEEEPLTYAVAVYGDPNLTAIVWQKTDIPASGPAGGMTSVVSAPLEDNKSYWWRVRAVEFDGDLGPWSEVARFVVSLGGEPPSKPILAGPPSGTAFAPTDTIALQWRNSTDPEGDPITYRVEILNLREQVVTFEEDIAPADEINTFSPKVVLADGTYNWRVKAFSAGQESPWSNSATFQIATPQVEDPNNEDPNNEDPNNEESDDPLADKPNTPAASTEDCTQASGRPGLGWGLLLVGLAFLARRRARR